MSASRQLKLADGHCVWCGGVVIGNHRDRKFCSDECRGLMARFRRLCRFAREAVDEDLLQVEYRAIELADAEMRYRRLEAA
jgi:hypothetical protein